VARQVQGTVDRLATTIRASDQSTFAELTERYRPELQVHCYRMLASFEDAEDLVQETLLRAWRNRDRFEGRSTLRAWLYRIATNACLDFLERHPRQPRPYQGPPMRSATPAASPPDSIPWLQPYPDVLLDLVASSDTEPATAVIERETIELAFLAAIQHLPPKQRAVLILRDVLGWSANETAGLLELSVAAVKSALQRARPTLKRHLPEQRMEWAPSSVPTEAERSLLQRYMDADDLPGLLRQDLKLTMPPNPVWLVGRDPFLAMHAAVTDPASPEYFGEWRSLPARANRQPAAGHYVRRPGDSLFRAQVLDVLRVAADGKIAEITSFVPSLFPTFGLPLTLGSEAEPIPFTAAGRLSTRSRSRQSGN
jgi:RNA polymerase sigma-70 factor, ECF subfamily